MRCLYIYCFICSLFTLLACTRELPSVTQPGETEICPDYIGVTVPINIAPLNFRFANQRMDGMVRFKVGDNELVVVADNGAFSIPEKEWRSLTKEASGKEIDVNLYFREDGSGWKEMEFPIYISADSIEPYLAYRRIFPGYRMWNEMGIYLRCVETFEERPILTNNETNNSCMNCHSFSERNGDRLLFHQRGSHNGTYIVEGDKVRRISLERDGKPASFVYPYWHPSGRYVAFSTNETHQDFHQHDANRIEVYDVRSDLLIYDVDNGVAFSSPLLASKSSLETFPTFTPDGKSLIFCSADSVDMPDEYRKIGYNLLRVDFCPENGMIGERVDTLYNANRSGGSATFPRVSPDGRWLLFTLSDYGTFPIWHKEADLYMMDLSTSAIVPLSHVNSQNVDSYHSWSGNSRWFVFSSRRGDGLFTRPYFVHVDGEGRCSKPFILPQEQADYYDRSLYSFNVPELLSTPPSLSRRAAVEATFNKETYIVKGIEGL